MSINWGLTLLSKINKESMEEDYKLYQRFQKCMKIDSFPFNQVKNIEVSVVKLKSLYQEKNSNQNKKMGGYDDRPDEKIEILVFTWINLIAVNINA